jgi:hypothetical protein
MRAKALSAREKKSSQKVHKKALTNRENYDIIYTERKRYIK